MKTAIPIQLRIVLGIILLSYPIIAVMICSFVRADRPYRKLEGFINRAADWFVPEYSDD